MFEKSLKEYNAILCKGIGDLLGCEVVKSNITAHVPDYPFVSFTVTNLQTRGGTYGNDGTHKFIAASVSYSWTVQSGDDYEAFALAQKLHDWFEEDGHTYLRENGMVFTGIGPITNRDNLLTVAYEYRKGFDCTLNLMNYTEQNPETIEKFYPEFT